MQVNLRVADLDSMPEDEVYMVIEYAEEAGRLKRADREALENFRRM
jgi:hypothetical protein